MDSTLPTEIFFDLYACMYRIRAFEERLQTVYRSGVMPGFVHLYIGEEAVAAGVCSHLSTEDYVTSTHRGHGHAVAKGVPLGPLFAEIWGQTRGTNGGRGGSMHIYDPDCGFLGTNGIVAAGIPIASGAATAAVLQGRGQVAISFFGDGATNNAAFHEGINLAGAWSLPVVFVCENNLYATETPLDKATKNTDVSSKASAYGIPGMQVDGNDVVAVYQAAGTALARARAGEGPTLIECKTYRPVGHFEGDPGIGYRTKDEIAEWKQRDPIRMLLARFAAEDTSAQQRIDDITRMIDGEVEEAYQFAEASPEADPRSVADHVYPTA